MSFDEFILLIPEENTTFNELLAIFSTFFYGLEKELTRSIATYLFENTSKLSRSQIAEKLKIVLDE